ncbi:MAG: phosphotransferase enzyme family protein [Propionibacteriaceae bacterium]
MTTHVTPAAAHLDLAHRDRAVPGLTTILSDELLSDWLAEHSEQLLERRYLRYKPGTSCLVGLRLASGDAFALAVAADALPKLDKTVARAHPGSILAVDRGRGLVVARSSADRDLPALQDTGAALAELARKGVHLGGRPIVRTLVHKPQRRWVALVTSEGARPVLIRAYRRRDLRRAVAAHRTPPDNGILRTPRLLAVGRRYGVLALEYVPGRTVDPEHTDTDTLEELGAGLADLHAHPADGLPAMTIADPADTADLISRLLPDLAPVTAEILERLAADRTIAQPLVPGHGDLSADQFLITPDGRPGLIDWDRAGQGEAGYDLANLVASSTDDHFGRAVLAGYARVHPLPTLQGHLAGATLARAADPFRQNEPDWPAQVTRRVDRVLRRLT